MRRTRSVVALLSAMDSERWRYAAHLTGATGLSSSLLSRLLRRLEADGAAESRWEDPREANGGDAVGWSRARRHLFRLTPAGTQLKAEWVSE